MKPCMLGVGCLWPHWRISLAELYLLKPCLWIFLVAEMLEYCGCYGKFVWPRGDPLEDWEVGLGPEL
jgi:hypothetical protein